MNALQPLPPPKFRPRSRSRSQSADQRRQKAQHTLAFEIGVKLGVNAVLALVAGVTLIRLIPHTAAQQAKLNELKTEVTAAQHRVDTLQTDFNRYFDPQQTQQLMQEQTNQIGENQLKIILVDPLNRLNE
ncbi:MAG: hypothetical protein HC881_05210 [Leptolyngbyaceae cyanobacterium SL_7_1]|nr:hypothetical protein [Leptolyngbyaceae cyanobacterium SL_7_1]